MQLFIDIPNADKSKTDPIMIRDDIPSINETLTGVNSADFLVVLGGLKTYTLHWSNYVPHTFSVIGDGLERLKTKGNYLKDLNLNCR